MHELDERLFSILGVIKMKGRWKYSGNAEKARFCAMPKCNKRLTKDEVVICLDCYIEQINEEVKENGK